MDDLAMGHGSSGTSDHHSEIRLLKNQRKGPEGPALSTIPATPSPGLGEKPGDPAGLPVASSGCQPILPVFLPRRHQADDLLISPSHILLFRSRPGAGVE